MSRNEAEIRIGVRGIFTPAEQDQLHRDGPLNVRASLEPSIFTSLPEARGEPPRSRERYYRWSQNSVRPKTGKLFRGFAACWVVHQNCGRVVFSLWCVTFSTWRGASCALLSSWPFWLQHTYQRSGSRVQGWALS